MARAVGLGVSDFSKMTGRFAIRICGVLLFLLGVALTLWAVFLVYAHHGVWPGIVFPGTVLIAYGLGVVALGEMKPWNKDGRMYTPRSARYYVIIGFVMGAQISRATKQEDFLPLQQGLECVQEKLGLREPLVTSTEVNAQVKAVAARAAELEKRRAALPPANAEALKQFNHDIAEYNERNRAAAALKAKYEARLAKEAQTKAKLIGSWKFQYDDYGLWHDRWSLTGQITFSADGQAFYECTSVSDQNEKSTFSWSGPWELEGDHLRARVKSKSSGVTSEIGTVHEYLIHDVTATELHYRDLNDGAERVRYRVSQ